MTGGPRAAAPCGRSDLQDELQAKPTTYLGASTGTVGQAETGGHLAIPCDAFVHPLDRKAMHTLRTWVQGKPGLQARLQRLVDSYADEAMTFNLADNTRAGPRQAPELLRCVSRVATSLGTPVPTVFINSDPQLDASIVSGSKKAALVFNTALLDSFTTEEIAVVAGHELGHVVADHGFYLLLARNGLPVVDRMLSAIPGGSLVALTLQYLVHDWYRKAELTADRAALVATGDLEVVQRVIVKLAGWTERHQIDVDEFREQALEYRRLLQTDRKSQTLLHRIEEIAAILMAEGDLRSHPWPALRFLEITEWSESDQYAAILREDFHSAAISEVAEMPLPGEATLASTVSDTARAVGGVVAAGWRAARSALEEHGRKRAPDRKA